MPARTERLQRILEHPLDYLHPERLRVPPLFDRPQSRDVLDTIIVQGLELTSGWSDIKPSPVTDLWIECWLSLPRVARLMGAQAAWPHLAKGAALQHLSPTVRAFGPCAVSRRLDYFEPASHRDNLAEQLDTIGLNGLLAWRAFVPSALIERLFLQFSARVIECQRLLAPATPDAALLTLAIQHARIHPHPD